MGAWRWKLATAASSSTTLALLVWMMAAPQGTEAPQPEPVAPTPVAVQPPAGLMRAYPHLADAMREDPVGALVNELHQAKGAGRKCELIEALGVLGGDPATAALGEVLQSRSAPRVRRCAVNSLALIPSTPATSWLSEVVRDGDTSIRATAIHSLAAREDPVARQVLIDLTYDEDERLRQEALLALVEAGAPDVAEVIIAELAEADLNTQEKYVRALRQGKAAAAIPALEQLAQHGHEGVRPAAIEAWAYVAGDAATEKLVAVLRDGPVRSRMAVLDALEEIASERARVALREAAQSEAAGVATAALRILARMEGDDIHALMLEELGGREPERIGVAIAYFVERGDASCAPRLSALARAGSPSVRAHALRGLVQLGGQSSREVLLGIARETGPLRSQVLVSLAEAGVPGPQRCELFERIVRENSSDSATALDLLSREGGPIPGRVMADLLDRGGPLAGQAADALGASGDDRSLTLLARAARSSTPATRLAALGSLGRTGSVKAAPWLRAAMDDEDMQVRHAAYQSMFALGGQHAERAALKLLQSEEMDEQRWALQALRGTRSDAARSELVRVARDEHLGATAMSILAEVEPETAASLAREAIRSDTPARQAQALGMASLLDPETAGSVVEAGLLSRQNGVISSAVFAATNVRTPGVEREMLAILRDENIDEWTRRRAAEQIRGWGGSVAEQVREDLDKFLGPVQ